MAAMQIKLVESFRAVFYAPFYATLALGFYATESVEVDFLSSLLTAVGRCWWGAASGSRPDHQPLGIDIREATPVP